MNWASNVCFLFFWVRFNNLSPKYYQQNLEFVHVNTCLILVIPYKITSKMLRSTLITKKQWPLSFILMRFLLIPFRAGNLVVPDNEGCNLFSRTSEIGRLAKRILSNSCAGGMFSLESAFGHILVYCS